MPSSKERKSAEIGEREDGNEPSSSSISVESKAADGTGVESASNTDGTGTESASNTDENRYDESSDENSESEWNDPQLEEKQYAFLKKPFDELRTRKRLPNWYKRYGERTTLKPVKFEDLLCECHPAYEDRNTALENECLISGNTNEEETLVGQESTTAQLGASTKSQIDPLAEHTNTCNVSRLNLYFRTITEYFIRPIAHPNLFLLDPDPDPNTPVDYAQKAMREVRKATVLWLNEGLDNALEDWDNCMTGKDVKKWEMRNNIRLYLHSILKNMLESLIGRNESPTESEDSTDDSTLSPSERRNVEIDQEKLIYQSLKRDYKEVGENINKRQERRRYLNQKATCPLVLKERKKIMAMTNRFLSLALEVSSEESESGVKQNKKRIRSVEQKKKWRERTRK